MKLLKFTAPWCGQCRVLTKQMSSFNTCDVVAYDVEDEENESLIERYSIKNLPLLVLVDDNDNEIKRWPGIVNVNTLKSEIESLAQ